VNIHIKFELGGLNRREERALAVFERKILRKIYGPVKETNYGEFEETIN